ncbi:neurotrimin-like isoform X2 [Tubulanus polymorphus]|uniref:neurotrimin-like isoform X2 n=1 Tax=Tubulanus polymorphus TaxID=672921 RepID=UPI003DA236AB
MYGLNLLIVSLGIITVSLAVVEGLQFKTEPQKISEVIGMNTVFECAFDEPLGQGQSLAWRKGETILSFNDAKFEQSGNFQVVTRADGLGYDLELSNLEVKDEGTYSCVLNNPKMIQHNSLTIIIKAQIHMKPEDYDRKVHLGKLLAVHCDVSGRPAPNVTWTKLGSDLIVHGSELLIENAKKTDGGEYECKAINMVGQPVTDVISVTVLYQPEVEVIEQNVYTGAGVNAKLQCKFSASPAARIIWTKDEVNVETMPNVEIMRRQDGMDDISILVIKNVDKDSLGTYVCEGSNEFGSAAAQVKLEGTPKKVEITSPESAPYSNVYTVTWKTVSHDSPIEYLLQFRSLNGTTPTAWHNTTIPGNDEGNLNHEGSFILRKGDIEALGTYQVIISARNDFGWSEPSDLFTFKTPQGDTSRAAGSNIASTFIIASVATIITLLIRA